MRRLLVLILMSVTLTACQMAAPSAPPAAEPAVTEPETATEATALETQPAPPALPDVTPPPEPPALALQRTACQDSGGQLMTRARGIYACVHPTRDAGRSCTAASDCQGLCLARSGTCAPFRPVFGCQEVFTARNHRETLCID